MPKPDTTRRHLSPGKCWLVDLMTQVGFGRIERVAVRDGDPAKEPPPRVVRTVRLGAARTEAHREPCAPDFALKREVAELLDECMRLGEGVIERIEVRGGLPFLAEIAQALRA